MNKSEKDRLIDDFLNGRLDLAKIEAFRVLLETDLDFRKHFATELELQKSLDPDGDYQYFKEQLGKAQGELFKDDQSHFEISD